MGVLSDLVPTVQPEVAAICLLGTLWRQPKKLQHAMPDSVSQLQSYFSCVIGITLVAVQSVMKPHRFWDFALPWIWMVLSCLDDALTLRSKA